LEGPKNQLREEFSIEHKSYSLPGRGSRRVVNKEEKIEARFPISMKKE